MSGKIVQGQSAVERFKEQMRAAGKLDENGDVQMPISHCENYDDIKQVVMNVRKRVLEGATKQQLENEFQELADNRTMLFSFACDPGRDLNLIFEMIEHLQKSQVETGQVDRGIDIIQNKLHQKYIEPILKYKK